MAHTTASRCLGTGLKAAAFGAALAVAPPLGASAQGLYDGYYADDFYNGGLWNGGYDNGALGAGIGDPGYGYGDNGWGYNGWGYGDEGYYERMEEMTDELDDTALVSEATEDYYNELEEMYGDGYYAYDYSPYYDTDLY